jgi:hypothetical protein
VGARRRARAALIATVAAVLVVAGVAVAVPPSDASQELSVLLATMEAAYAGVTDYTARFIRREVVAGHQRSAEEALLKFQRPGRIYLRWTAGAPRGREIIFVPGRDGDRALVHEPGLISGRFTVLMAPDHRRILAESSHPITDVGLGRLIELIASNVRRGMARGDVQLIDHGDGGHRRRIELSFPRDPSLGYYCRRFLATLRNGLPITATVYDVDDRLVAEYAYHDLRLNPGLTETDFDPANPAYNFPGLRLSL